MVSRRKTPCVHALRSRAHFRHLDRVAGWSASRPAHESMPEELRRESRFVWPDRMTLSQLRRAGNPGSGLQTERDATAKRAPRCPLFSRHAGRRKRGRHGIPTIQFLASNGYLVFAPNVRGSGGHGRDYRELVVGQGGDHDVRDALFGLDRLSSDGLIDNERVGVLGAGTGGFLTTAALIRGETRFKAAVCINAIVDAVTAASYPETAEWARYMIGATPLENPAGVLRAIDRQLRRQAPHPHHLSLCRA